MSGYNLILQKWCLILAWLPVENMVHEHQEEYYQALNIAQHNGETQNFAAFMLRMLKDLLLEIREGQAGNVGDYVVDRARDHTEMVLFILQKQPKATARSIAELTHLSICQAE